MKSARKSAAKVPARMPAKTKAAGKSQPVSLKAKHSAAVKTAPKAPPPRKVRAEDAAQAAAPVASVLVAGTPVADTLAAMTSAEGTPAEAVAAPPVEPLVVEEEPVVPAARPAPASSAPSSEPVVEVEAEISVTVAEIIARAHVADPAPLDLRAVPAASAPRGFPPRVVRPGPAGGMQPGRPMVGPPPRPPAPPETFVEGDHVVYPTHGVGKIERIVTESIAGYRLELIHITFEENRMTLRVPVEKARSAGLRKLASRQLFDAALTTLRGRARIKRTMWSRRAQEYEAKINSGDPLAIAEVVRDLHRNAGQPDQSFSERQIYEAAMDRLAAELAALDNTDKATAAEKLTTFMKAA